MVMLGAEASPSSDRVATLTWYCFCCDKDPTAMLKDTDKNNLSTKKVLHLSSAHCKQAVNGAEYSNLLLDWFVVCCQNVPFSVSVMEITNSCTLISRKLSLL